MGFLRKVTGTLILMLLAFVISARSVMAAPQFGIHVLRPEEFAQTAQLFTEVRKDKSQPIYVTIPFTLDDMEELERWQTAFTLAKQENIVPLVRISTRFEPSINAWQVPERKDILDISRALNQLEWPQDERYVILFNETNHAAEWGGTIDPVSFAEITAFAADWFNTEGKGYRVLPAAMDLAAPNGPTTKEALAYWETALQHEPTLLDKFYGWNSHSYPNPGFSAAPNLGPKNNVAGYRHELEFLAKKTSRELPVFITETGWSNGRLNKHTLVRYYDFAVREAWSDDRVVAVTPFLLSGSPGPFGGFSFLDEGGKPTVQWQALAQVLADHQRRLVTLNE